MTTRLRRHHATAILPRMLQSSLASLLFLLLMSLACPASLHAGLMGGLFDSTEEEDLITRAEVAFEKRDYATAWSLACIAIEDYQDSYEAIRTFVLVASATNHMSVVPGRFNPIHAGDDRIRARCYYARGWMAFIMSDYDDARRQYEMALKFSGAPADFELRRAMLLLDRVTPGVDKRSFLARVRGFAEEHPDVPLAWLGYINSLERMQAPQSELASAIARAMERGRQLPEFYIRKARLAERDFWFDPAVGLDIIDAGLARFPESADLALQRIEYLRRLGETERALAEAKGWMDKAPNHGQFITEATEMLTILGRKEEAIAVVDRLRGLVFHPTDSLSHPLLRARLLYSNNQRDQAIAELITALGRDAYAGVHDQLRSLLYQLQAAEPSARVQVIPGTGMLQQRGNYCGPATLSMLLRRWGVTLAQEDVASNVYTGIAGTPPQVLHHFAHEIGFTSREFEGNDQSWRSLLDAGLPVLWLQMNGFEGAHYRLVVGYDDFARAWIVHDPNYTSALNIPYGKTDDTWFLPSLRRSMVLMPKELPTPDALIHLEPTVRLVVSNWVMYVATGANLFLEFWPALLLNAFVALSLGWLLAVLIRQVTWPVRDLSVIRLTLFFAVPVMLLNVAIGGWRLSGAVGVLLALHLALATLIPVLALLVLFRRTVRDYLHPRESIGLVLLVMGTWLCLSAIDVKPWETLAPMVLLGGGLPFVMWPRWRLWSAARILRRGDVSRAAERLRPLGWNGERYFAAIVLEMDCLLQLREFDRIRETAAELRQERRFDHVELSVVALFDIAARVLEGDAEVDGLITKAMSSTGIPDAHRLLLRGMRLYAGMDDGGTDAETLLAAVDRLGRRPLPGLPRSRSHAGETLQRAVLLLTLVGAVRAANERGDAAEATRLRRKWGERFRLLAPIYVELESGTEHPVMQLT